MSTGTKTKTTIELNGQLYDARTGRMINHMSENKPHTPKLRVIDDFAARPKPISPVKIVTAKVVTPVAVAIQPAIEPLPAKPAVERPVPARPPTKLEKSKTLMRPAVKKPAPVINHHASTGASYKKEDHNRSIRAASAQKSPFVRRYHPVVHHRIVKKEAVMPVAPQVNPVAKQISNQVAHLATSTEAQVHKSVDVIEESLRNASAHLEKFEDNVVHNSFWTRFGFRHKAANLASLGFAGMLLIGFFAYQNAPNIEMRLAAAQSGISAGMPGYSPAGFSASRDINSEPGKVSVAFHSNTDNKKFTVTQQASNWSSEALLSNNVLSSKKAYQTYQNKGKTVYVYDGSDATWVNGGILYNIDGDATLTSDQLLRIANSL